MDPTNQKAQEAARERIKLAMIVTGWTPTELARHSGLAPSTLNRFLNQDVKHTLSVPTLTKIDQAVQTFIRSLADKSEAQRLSQIYGTSTMGTPTVTPVAQGTITIMVRGEVRAGYFTSAAEYAEEDQFPITLPSPGGRHNFFGLKVVGPSMNEVYPEGTIVVCCPIWEYDEALEEEDHVVVQRWENGLVEATVKELRHDPDGQPWLWPRSTHPEHQSPIRLPTNGKWLAETDIQQEVRIVAVVVADYRIRKRG